MYHNPRANGATALYSTTGLTHFVEQDTKRLYVCAFFHNVGLCKPPCFVEHLTKVRYQLPQHPLYLVTRYRRNTEGVIVMNRSAPFTDKVCSNKTGVPTHTSLLGRNHNTIPGLGPHRFYTLCYHFQVLPLVPPPNTGTIFGTRQHTRTHPLYECDPIVRKQQFPGVLPQQLVPFCTRNRGPFPILGGQTPFL